MDTEPSTQFGCSKSNGASSAAQRMKEYRKRKRDQDRSEANKSAAKRMRAYRERKRKQALLETNTSAATYMTRYRRREENVTELYKNDVKHSFDSTEKPDTIRLGNVKYKNDILPTTIPVCHVVEMKENEGLTDPKRMQRTSEKKNVPTTTANNETEFMAVIKDAKLFAESSGNITSNHSDLPVIEHFSNKLRTEAKDMKQLILTHRNNSPATLNNESGFMNIVEDFTENSENITTNLRDLETCKDLKKIKANEIEQFNLITSNQKSDPHTTPEFVSIVEAAESSTQSSISTITNHSNLQIKEKFSKNLEKIDAKEKMQLVNEFDLNMLNQQNDTSAAQNNDLEFVGIIEATEPVTENIVRNHSKLPTTNYCNKDLQKLEANQMILTKSSLITSNQKIGDPEPELVSIVKIAEPATETSTTNLPKAGCSKGLKKIEGTGMKYLVRGFDLMKTLKKKKIPSNKDLKKILTGAKELVEEFDMNGTPAVSFKPVHKCIVRTCKSTTARKGNKITFISFCSLVGKNIEEWLKLLNLKCSHEWARTQMICSMHFAPDDFVDSTRLRLRRGVVPNRFLNRLPEIRVVLKRLADDVLQYHLTKGTCDRLRDIGVRLKDDLVEESNERPSIAHEQSDLLYSLVAPDQLGDANGDKFIRQLHNYSYNPVQYREVSAELHTKLGHRVKTFNATSKKIEFLKVQLKNYKDYFRYWMKQRRITRLHNPHIFRVLKDMKQLWWSFRSRQSAKIKRRPVR